MTNQQQAPSPRRVRPKPRMVTVSRVEHLTPQALRITFTGDELEGFTTHGPAEHFKVFFPEPGESRLEMPEWGPEGPILDQGRRMPPSRTYTPRYWRPETRELVVDFMLHGDSLASTWARSAAPGTVTAISGQPGGAYTIDETADWFLIAGDESALPAIGTILEALPPAAGARVIVEVEHAAEEQPLTSPASVEVTWMHREAGAVPGAALEGAVRGVEMPRGRNRVWVGCEASIMRNIRRHLLNDRGMDRGHMHTHGYWKLGEANHPDHDVGQDI